MSKRHVLVNALSVTSGGGRTFLVHLVQELARDDRGLACTVLVQSGSLDVTGAGDVVLREVAFPSRGRLLWRLLYELVVVPIITRRFDALFCVGDLAPRFAGSRVVVLLCNLNIYDHRWYPTFRLRLLERLVRMGLPRADRIVFPSQAAAAEISRRVGVDGSRGCVVHFGVDPPAQRTGGSAPLRRYMFLAAAIEKHKNIGVLIDALVRGDDSELELWIAGHDLTDPEYRTDLERRATRAGVAHRVKFLGPRSHSELTDLYRAAEFFVFPSLLETFGFPLLEAMSLATPVLAADVPVFREVAGEAAWYFDPNDADSLLRAIDRLRADSGLRAERIAIGLKRAAELSWPASVDGFCEVIHEVIDETDSNVEGARYRGGGWANLG